MSSSTGRQPGKGHSLLPQGHRVNIVPRHREEIALPDISHSWSPEDALVALMFAVSASDEALRTAELLRIEALVNHLPVFGNYDPDRITVVTRTVLDLFTDEDGLDALFGLVRDNLPEKLWETAYALCCDVAVSDGKLGQGELRLLEAIRDELTIDRLHAAAIEWGARVRHMTV
jgi:tellurite resistance protein